VWVPADNDNRPLACAYEVRIDFHWLSGNRVKRWLAAPPVEMKSLVRDIVERATITADRIEIRLGKQKQRPAHDDALRGLAGTMASPQIMCIRAKADIVEKPKPEPSH
jgi:hypothetical protein